MRKSRGGGGKRRRKRPRGARKVEKGKIIVALTWAGLRRQGEDEGGGALPAGDGAAEALRLEGTQLLHEVRALHQGHVGEVQVAQDLVFEAARPLLVRPGEVEPARVAPQAFLVVVVVVVQWRRLCQKTNTRCVLDESGWWKSEISAPDLNYSCNIRCFAPASFIILPTDLALTVALPSLEFLWVERKVRDFYKKFFQLVMHGTSAVYDLWK